MSTELLTRLSEKRLAKVTIKEVSEAHKTLSFVIDKISNLDSEEEQITALDLRYGFLKNSLLHLAAKFGDDLAAAKILDIASKIHGKLEIVANVRNEDSFTPLHFAAYSGNPGLAEALLSAGAENNPKASVENRSWTPIHYASQFGHAEIVELLINSGVDQETLTGFGLTPLVVGAEFGNLNVVEMMLRLGANKDAQTIEDNHCMTALHYAAVGNFRDVAITLLRAGVNRSKPTSSGLSALDLAIQSDHSDMVGLLLSWGIGDMDHALKLAVESKAIASVEKIKYYISARKDFFNIEWLLNFIPQLIETLKKCSRENIGSIRVSPSFTTYFNAYGILALKHKVGFISKSDETLLQFCAKNQIRDLATVLHAIQQML